MASMVRLTAISRAGCAFTLASLLSAPAAAQSTAVVTGRVSDETGGVLPGVSVDLHSGATELTAVTDNAGLFRLEQVPPGAAELTFKLINFALNRRTLAIGPGETVTANAVLTLSITADVVVTGVRTFRNIADLDNPAESLVGVASAASQGAI